MERRNEKLADETCGKTAVDTIQAGTEVPRRPSPRERLLTQVDNAQSSLLWKLNQYQELRDRIRFANDLELGLMADYIDKLFLFNS